MKIKKFCVFSIFFIFGLLPSNFAHAAEMTSFDYPSDEIKYANASLDSTSAISIEVTPLFENRFVGRAWLGWTWVIQTPTEQRNVYIQLGSDYDSLWYSQSWIWMRSTELPTSGPTGISCERSTEIPSGGGLKSTTLYCGKNQTFRAGDTYRWEFNNKSTPGLNWWHFTLTDVSHYSKIDFGNIDLGGTPISSDGMAFHLGYTGNSIACSDVPIADTVVSNFRISGQSISPTGFSTSTCTPSDVSPNLGPLGGTVLKLGGSDLESRNLENAPIQPTNTPKVVQDFNPANSSNQISTNNQSPLIDVTGIRGTSTVLVIAVDSSGAKLTCEISGRSVAKGSGNCRLPVLHDGVWIVTSEQTLGGKTSPPSSPLTLTVDTAPLTIGLSQSTDTDGQFVPIVTSNKSGVGYLFDSALVINSPSDLSNTQVQSVFRFDFNIAQSGHPLNTEGILPGSYRLFFQDFAGNYSVDDSEEVRILPDAPDKPKLIDLAGDAIQPVSNNNSPRVKVDGAVFSTEVTALSSSGERVTCLASDASIFESPICQFKSLKDGNWKITATQSFNGVVSKNSEPVNIQIDTILPKLIYTIDRSKNSLYVTSNKNGKVFLVPASSKVRTNGDVIMAATNPKGTLIRKSQGLPLPLKTLRKGIYRVYEVDQAGNLALAPGDPITKS